MNRTRSQFAGLLVALLVLAALPFSGTAAASATAVPDPTLRFGQTFVLADFNNNGELDRARIASNGSLGSIEIRLALTGETSWLHFETGNRAPGSLFSKDLDRDGDADLIWTDLLHQEAVVIWLGDGRGRFERAGADEFAPDFLLGGFSLTAPDEESREQASDDEANSPVALEINSHCTLARAPALPDCLRQSDVLPIGAVRRPTSRGPPAFRI